MLLVYLRSFVGWTLSWHALHSLCIVESWWMHCQQGGGRIAQIIIWERCFSRGSFACIAFERGSSVSGGACITWSILFYHMIGVEPFLPFLKGSCYFVSIMSSLCPCLRGLRKFELLCSLFDLCLIDSILSHDFLCPFSPFFRDHVIFFCLSRVESLPLP